MECVCTLDEARVIGKSIAEMCSGCEGNKNVHKIELGKPETEFSQMIGIEFDGTTVSIMNAAMCHICEWNESKSSCTTS